MTNATVAHTAIATIMLTAKSPRRATVLLTCFFEFLFIMFRATELSEAEENMVDLRRRYL